MPQDQGTPPPGGKRKGKLPTWAWVAIGVAGVGAYYLYSRSKAAAAASAPPANTGGSAAMIPVAAGSFGGGGGGGADLSRMLPLLQNMNGAPSSGVAYSAPKGEALTGAGYGPQNPTAPITSASGGIFQEVGSWAAAQPLIAAGQTLYYQPSPGVFTPAAQNGQLLLPPGTNTPLFVSQGQSA